MNKILFFTLMLVLFSTSTVFGAGKGITVDGKAVTPDNIVYNDAGDRAYIKLSEAASMFNVAVSFNNGTAAVEKNGHKVTFETGGKEYVMDGLARRDLGYDGLIVENGEHFIPVRALCEVTGASLTWLDDTKTAVIKTGAMVIPEKAVPYLQNVQVFDQSSIRIAGEKVIYIDPWKIVGTPHDADIILVTHTHSDHLDPDSIKNIMKDTTQVYISEDGVDAVTGVGAKNVTGVAPDQSFNVGGISIKTVPAYDLSHTDPTRMNHLKQNNWVGYAITVGSINYYAAGDTDYVPELQGLQADVAFLPIDGMYNMTPQEAAQMANALSPKIAVPYHYDNFITEDKATEFVSLLNKDITGVIMTFKMY